MKEKATERALDEVKRSHSNAKKNEKIGPREAEIMQTQA